MASEAPYNVATIISLEDFADRARAEQCIQITNKKGYFIGDPGAASGLAYPHIHVWTDAFSTIALSVAPGTNYKIGKNGVIDITELYIAFNRDKHEGAASYLRNTIGWVLSAAS